MSDEFVRKETHDANIETLAVAVDDTNSRIDDLRDEVKERISDMKDSINRTLNLFALGVGILQIGLAVLLYFLTKK